jgi:hypothetical protein
MDRRGKTKEKLSLGVVCSAPRLADLRPRAGARAFLICDFMAARSAPAFPAFCRETPPLIVMRAALLLIRRTKGERHEHL